MNRYLDLDLPSSEIDLALGQGQDSVKQHNS